MNLVDKGAGSTAFGKTLGMSKEQVGEQVGRLCKHRKYIELHDELAGLIAEKRTRPTVHRINEINQRINSIRDDIKILIGELNDGSKQEIEE